MSEAPTNVEASPIVRLDLRFFGEAFDPDEITRQLGIEPTTAFRPDDPITPDGEGRRRGFGWRLTALEREGLDIQDMLQEFRGRIPVPGQLMRQVCRDLDVRAVVFCGVRQHGSQTTPALTFPPDFVGWVAELGASIEIDLLF
jgi:hypothetical protein